MKIEKFEDIESWKKARELTPQIYQITASGPFAKGSSQTGRLIAGFMKYLAKTALRGQKYAN